MRYLVDNFEAFKNESDSQPSDFNIVRYNNEKKRIPDNEKVWESAVVVPFWEVGELIIIELYPITLGFGKAKTECGRPILTEPELGNETLNDIKRLSEPYETNVICKNGIGYIIP